MPAVEFLKGFERVLSQLPWSNLEAVLAELVALKQRGGRLFFLGVGGSAANASHAVNDFRKICGIEAYAPTDNVAELTAITNDMGWSVTFVEWLAGSRLQPTDAVFVLSVGGGSLLTGVSPNISLAVGYAKGIGAPILSIVGRDGGDTLKQATACILVPTVDKTRITPFVESAQSLLLHLLATDPALSGTPREIVAPGAS